jgi:hypothetical protein
LRQEGLLYPVQVGVTLAPEFLFWVVTVSVFIHSIWGIVSSNNEDFFHSAIVDERIQGVLAHPGIAHEGSFWIEQILTIMHNKDIFVYFQCVFIVAGREVDDNISVILELRGIYIRKDLESASLLLEPRVNHS